MANKLTTLGYFKKRLRDSGYIVDDLFTNYGEVDPRAWSVIIDPKVASIICTCYVNDPGLGETYFELHDGGQFIPNRLYKLKTSSVEVFVTHLVEFGINNKSSTYPDSVIRRNNEPQQPRVVAPKEKSKGPEITVREDGGIDFKLGIER